MLDVAAFVGPYPFRALPAHGPEDLLRAMDAVGIDRAWVAHLPAFLYRDPAPGNRELYRVLAAHDPRLVPVPTVHPALPGWDDDLQRAADRGAPAVRVYPTWQGVDPVGGAMRVLVGAAAALDLPLVLTVRLEDRRQRHPLDIAPDLPAAAVRTLVRADPAVRLLVTHADRAFIEEVHFGLTPAEARRILWEISWIWGPPEDHLALLIETVGADRFAFGTGMPLRLPEAAVAKLDLLDVAASVRDGIAEDNVRRWRDGDG